MKTCTLRIYAELNDFLPEDKKQVAFAYQYAGPLKVHEALLSLKIPRSEVDLVLVNGVSTDLDYWLNNGDYISVYPVFETFDISSLNSLRPAPLRISKFILDVHLGKLTKFLRMAGFDSLYSDTFEDNEIIDISVETHRIILTRDNGLLRSKKVKHGYYVRSIHPIAQFKEVVAKFSLGSQFNPMMRCLKCNTPIVLMEKGNIKTIVKPKIHDLYNEFYTCSKCKNIYWKGSHYNRIMSFLEMVKRDAEDI